MNYISRIVLSIILQLTPLIAFVGRLFASDSPWANRTPWWEIWIPFITGLISGVFNFFLRVASSIFHFFIFYGWPAVILFFVVWGAYLYNRDMRNPNKND